MLKRFLCLYLSLYCMKYYARCILLLMSLLRMPAAAAQQLTSILQEIRAFNEVHNGGIGQGDVITGQYKNYMKLQAMATTEDLVSLTDDSNAAVNCYAAFELINRNYPDIVPLFAKLLTANKKITIYYGCMKMSGSNLWQDVYFHYLFKCVGEAKDYAIGKDSCVEERAVEQHMHDYIAQHETLSQMDSCILYSKNHIAENVLSHILDHRLYSPAHIPRIEYLAFERLNTEAIKYFETNYGNSYQAQIKQALLAYMQSSDGKKWGYYGQVEALLKYNDDTVNQAIVAQMTHDKTWRKSYRAYKKLFVQYDLKDILPSQL